GLMVSGSPFSPGVFGLSASFVGDPVFDGSGVSRSLVIGSSSVAATTASLVASVGPSLEGQAVRYTLSVSAAGSEARREVLWVVSSRGLWRSVVLSCVRCRFRLGCVVLFRWVCLTRLLLVLLVGGLR